MIDSYMTSDILRAFSIYLPILIRYHQNLTSDFENEQKNSADDSFS